MGLHDDVIKWKHFPSYWPFVRGIHRSPVNSPDKSQWRGTLMLSVICAWINVWVNNGEAGDLRRHRASYDVTVMIGIAMTNSKSGNYNHACCVFNVVRSSNKGHWNIIIHPANATGAFYRKSMKRHGRLTLRVMHNVEQCSSAVLNKLIQL